MDLKSRSDIRSAALEFGPTFGKSAEESPLQLRHESVRKSLVRGDLFAYRTIGEAGLPDRASGNLRRLPLYGVGSVVLDYFTNDAYLGQLHAASTANAIRLGAATFDVLLALRREAWARAITDEVSRVINHEKKKIEPTQDDSAVRLEESAVFGNGEFIRAQQARDYIMFKWSSLLPVQTVLRKVLGDVLALRVRAKAYSSKRFSSCAMFGISLQEPHQEAVTKTNP